MQREVKVKLVLRVQARARKTAAQMKLEQLQKDIAELASLSPKHVAEEEEVTRKLNEVHRPPFLLNGPGSRSDTLTEGIQCKAH